MRIAIKYILLLNVFSANLVAQTPDLVINEFLTSNGHVNYDPDYRNYSDWIELYNNEDYPINLSGYYLTDNLSSPNKWQILDDIIIDANGYFVFWADDRNTTKHTNFKLSKDGEEIGLFAPSGTRVDALTYGTQLTDVSFGRNPNNMDEWLYFAIPSPSTSNGPDGLTDPIKCVQPSFTINSGFYSNDINLNINTESGSIIRYTMDGSEPNKDSKIYSDQIELKNKGNVPNYFSEIATNALPYSWFPLWSPPQDNIFKASIVRARSFNANKIPSDIISGTYFIDPNIFNKYEDIPIISLISDEKHLFSDSAGIYVPGEYFNGSQGTGNYMKRWWRPAYIEYFENNGELKFSQGIRIKTQGSSSKTSPQKSLHIISSDKYGEDAFNYNIFADPKRSTNINRFILRAWGSVWNQGLISDALAQKSYSSSGLDLQNYKLVAVFINGEYWGLQEIREANKYPSYYEEHHGIDASNPGIDLLTGQQTSYAVSEGDSIHWQNLLDYLARLDVSNDENYTYVTTQVDIANFIDYIGHSAYFAKLDWPVGNEGLWRPKTVDGKWRWIQYDMDTCFGRPEYNMFKHLFEGTETWAPHILLSFLIKNEGFKNILINWFVDRINSDFKPEIVQGTYNTLLNELYPYLDEHQNRWAISKSNFTTFTTFIKNFISKRPEFVLSQLRDYFNLGNLNNIIIDRKDDYGVVKINSVLINHNTPRTQIHPYPWSGNYFEDIPIKISAIPHDGYEFVRWEGSFESDSDTLVHYLTKNAWLSPVFSPVKRTDSLYINEILTSDMCSPSAKTNELNYYIELYNASKKTVELKNFYLTNDFNYPQKWEAKTQDVANNSILPNSFGVLPIEYSSFEHEKVLLAKISGRKIALIQTAGNTIFFIDSLSYPNIYPNISYGRFPDGSESWYQLLTPSPGQKNIYSPSQGELNKSTLLLQSYPNPFNNFSNITVYLKDDKPYHLSIFDIKGSILRKIYLEPIKGYQVVRWEGTGANDKQVPSGIYFYSLYSDRLLQTKKLLFLK